MIQTGAIKIGGVDLNNSLQWTNRFQWANAQNNQRRTLGGIQVIYQQTVFAGQPITLEANRDTGWLTKAMVDSLMALAEADPGATRVFEFHGEFYNCKFLFGTDQRPIAFAPLKSKQVLAADDWMVGTIRLFTV